MANDTYDLLVIGAGVSGLSAACDAARQGLRVACIEQLMFGGLIVNINELSPSPVGYATNGAQLASDLMTQSTGLGVTILMEEVINLERVDESFGVVTNGACYMVSVQKL